MAKWKKPSDKFLNELLEIIDMTLEMAVHGPDPLVDPIAERYHEFSGALMCSLSRNWSRRLEEGYQLGHGEADGAFAAGPCKGTLRRLRRLLLEYKKP